MLARGDTISLQGMSRARGRANRSFFFFMRFLKRFSLFFCGYSHFAANAFFFMNGMPRVHVHVFIKRFSIHFSIHHTCTLGNTVCDAVPPAIIHKSDSKQRH